MPSPARAIAVAASLIAVAAQPGQASSEQALLQLLEHKRCPHCQLQGADLVHSQLQQAQLRGAQLQRANLSGALLDGADLRGANLSGTSLVGASLRGADLRGSILLGTDLRQANLNGAHLDSNGLQGSHWQGATGIDPGLHSYAALHNAGVAAAREGRHPEAERLFGEAIRRQPEAAVSWIARGISRSEQGDLAKAAQDFGYAAALVRQAGDETTARDLERAITELKAPTKPYRASNGSGSQLLSGALTAFQFLAPIAAKAFLPVGF